MRATVDIPDPIYQDLKREAALEGRTVKELILERVLHPAESGSEGRQRLTFPAVQAKHPGSLKLGPEGVYEYIPFP
jgi:hypothetical protein